MTKLFVSSGHLKLSNQKSYIELVAAIKNEVGVVTNDEKLRLDSNNNNSHHMSLEKSDSIIDLVSGQLDPIDDCSS